MALVPTALPALEPVTLAEAKAHLRVDSDAEDVLIQSLVITSRLHIEAALGLALISQGWRWSLDAWPRDGVLCFPIRPVQAVAEVRVLDPEGTPAVVPTAHFVLDGRGDPARLVRAGSSLLPTPGRTVAGIEIDFSAGFGPAAADVPAQIRQALLLLVAHWFENREPVALGDSPVPVPLAVSELLAPWRGRRL
jgi:uncharacterized phiE125 gp8 family phage protein